MSRKKLIIIASSSLGAILLIVTALLLYFYIPRMEYTYSTVYQGYLISKVYGNATTYVIPETYKGAPVKGVSTRAFYRHDKLETVEFENPANIEFIGRLAFSECSSLKSIDLTYVKEMERNAFSYDESLKSITTGCENIGASAFYGCRNLEDVTLISGVSSLGGLSFAECDSLTYLYLPDTVKNVYLDAFAYTPLSLLEAPSSLAYNDYVAGLSYAVFY